MLSIFENKLAKDGYLLLIKMAEGLARVLSKPGFDPENFVNKRAQGGEDEIQDVRKVIQALAEETAVALKRNVYKNYSQFIETAKEISILEGEMYQLSHMLTDQKSIMSTMLELSITGDKVEAPDDTEESDSDTQQNLALILEKVEGCSSVMEVPNRYLVHDGDLIELDPESLTTINKCHLFLLNDALLIATWLPQRRGPVKYRFQVLYELDSLAVVNARDVGGCKNAFKILMFPDTRMFQAENPKSKRTWLDILEETKKKKTAEESKRKEAASANRKSNASSSSMDPSNPFAEEDRNSRPVSAISMDTDMLHADWLMELPEDLDVCIAQRDFEGAVDLVNKVTEHLHSIPKSQGVREYKARVDHRIKQLTEVLVQELSVSPAHSLRGGPRAARRAVLQLIRLGKSAQACDLFLKNRSAVTQHNLRQLKTEGNTNLYIKKLCDVFFSSLMDTGKEFSKAFPENFGCYSAFVVWSKWELEEFVKLFTTQVFIPKASLSNVAECVSESRVKAVKLTEIGLELSFVMDTMILTHVTRVLKDHIDLQQEALRLRAQEDLWRPVNFQNKDAVEKFEEEMMEYGIMDIHSFTYDQCFTQLTANTIHFTRVYINTMSDMMKVYCQELHSMMSSALVELMLSQMRHGERSMTAPQFSKEVTTIQLNMAFLIEKVFTVVSEKYAEKTGFALPKSTELQSLKKKIDQLAQETQGEFV